MTSSEREVSQLRRAADVARREPDALELGHHVVIRCENLRHSEQAHLRAARAREGLERRFAQPRLDRRSAPVARAARALAVRAPAAIASAAAAERGGVEEEAILRAVVGRGSAPMGSACAHDASPPTTA